MSDFPTRLFPERYHDRLRAFLALPEFDRMVAYLMAMNGWEKEHESILEQLKLLGVISDERGAEYQARLRLKEVLQKLDAQGWLVRLGSGQKVVSREFIPVLLWLCAEADKETKTFRALAEARRRQDDGRRSRRMWRYESDSGVEAISRFEEAYYVGFESPFQTGGFRFSSDEDVVARELLDIVGRPFDLDRLKQLPENYRQVVPWAGIEPMLTSPFPVTPYLDLADASEFQFGDAGELVLAGEALIFSGQFEKAQALADRCKNDADNFSAQAVEQIYGWIAFIRGDYDTAITRFEASMERSVRGTRRRKTTQTGHCGIFFLMALLRRGTEEDFTNFKKIAKWGLDIYGPWGLTGKTLTALRSTMSFMTGGRSAEVHRMFEDDSLYATDNLACSPLFLFVALCCRWSGIVTQWTPPTKLRLLTYAEEAESNGFLWLASEAYELLAANAKSKGKETTGHRQKAESLRQQCHGEITPLVDLIKAPEAWERSLTALETLATRADGTGSNNREAGVDGGKRLLWLIEFDYSQSIGLVPYLQVSLKSGKLGRPRKCAIERLAAEVKSKGFVSNADRSAIEILSASYNRWYYMGRFGAEHVSALEVLVGSSNLYMDDSFDRPVEVVTRTPEISLTTLRGGKLKLKLLPEIDYHEAGMVVIRESDMRITLTKVRQAHIELNRILQSGTSFPVEAKERLVASLGKLSSEFSIESDSVGFETIARSVVAQSKPEVRLMPDGSGGIQVSMSVQPIADVGENYAPGSGKPVIFARSQQNEPLQTQRDLALESERAAVAVAACNSLQCDREESRNAWNWHFTEPDECLELLFDLDALGDDNQKVTWPEGEPLLPPQAVGASQFHASVKGSGQWLEANGELKVNDDLVLTMKQLMELLEQSNPGSRFIEISKGRFIALTRQFRNQLDDLRVLSSAGKGGARKFPPLAAFALAELEETATLKTGTAWKSQLKKFRNAENLQPKVPKTLRANLRSYQVEGYEWLARLAEWGAGACLADDMGLGKTVQALALLLSRAKGGPALVVAPTSVAANWIDEAARFAPTLEIVLYTGTDRKSRLESIGSHSLVITTYGILQRGDEQLTATEWHTVVLDEAQAIKNRATKRSKAAMQLQAPFRIVTTGTPVENRLDELHNLFSFLNPGLLGSAERFRKQFADPIERHKDTVARDRLRRVIKPFILRRMKGDVLKDLPPKTEVTLHVELDEEEAAFYEALRQKAMSDLEAAKKAPEGNAMRILAEITRLRRACCHPKLVQPKGAPESSKQRVFLETLTEILDGGHQVLVFSQFVDHLKIARKSLDGLGIEYQYLDGSTPAKKRKTAIEAFQSGEGNVFLISLKAGGSGLNLTAADYVIHLDPWWNPAVEDQASDRAHRIGQQRPVTVYRLVTKGTIEEKIVALHHDKRDLASAMLEGTDTAGRLTSEEMLALLREAGT
ncbi:MAG: superfamily II DNA or RNA helicase/tetratricopeptide (TPR) repeat protein [Verrucomicrobiales bacterium]|jgi:superfamily II DNA or RNA helicase/tetratricopeptide (TPR) repeat protein